MSTRKTLTREQYQKKFAEQMERFCYIRQEGEQIVQCKAPYPPFWFVSNIGYLFSAHKNRVKILKPNYRKTGKKNKNGERAGQDWYYEYREPGRKYNAHVNMHKIIADHFVEPVIDGENMEVHHIKKRNQFEPEQAKDCNCAENLQKLPGKVHELATYYGSKSDQQIDADTMEKAKNVPHYELTEEQMIRFVMQAMQQAIDAGEAALVIETNGADDPNSREVKVRKITSAPTLEP